MPFIPHTAEETRLMLESIGLSDIEELFDEIPVQLRSGVSENIPAGMSEMEITRLMTRRARDDGQPL